MPIKPLDELKATLSELLKNDDSDTALHFIEDFVDTFEDSNIDWKSKYQENDKNWRDKYRTRFFEGGMPKKEEENEEDEKPTILKYEDLFK